MAFSLRTSMPSLVLVPVCLLALFSTTTQAAQDATPALTIYEDNTDTFNYLGCYTETAGLANTTGERTLNDGINNVTDNTESNMTVPWCIDFCTKSTNQYQYVGLEYSRQCWCSRTRNPLSTAQPKAVCNTACDGNKTTACGGSGVLSVYNMTAEGKKRLGKGGHGGSAGATLQPGGFGGIVGLGFVVSGLGLGFGLL
ncbi:Uu.00g039020.m01.CDS01 [Anthostomella pinea]|uniref:Uu.00g039020.m01.CDS01 n=1 Tax=Anthostomella pinea TaxID=933095 RepID=A0AAI8V9X3_9PEZI|nr:Uu.00g039020.m01.CDS01 [Anthostomella pinea]